MKKLQSISVETPVTKPAEKITLTEKEAAIFINMSRSFLRHGRIDGSLEGRTPTPKFIKIGRAIRYPKKELDDWLAQFPRKTYLYEREQVVKHGGGHDAPAR